MPRLQLLEVLLCSKILKQLVLLMRGQYCSL